MRALTLAFQRKSLSVTTRSRAGTNVWVLSVSSSKWATMLVSRRTVELFALIDGVTDRGQTLNPLAQMLPSSKFDPEDLERLAPSLAVGVGLALREVDF